MRQAITSLLAQEPLDPHVANYLIESMRMAMSGEDANRAFALHDKRGRKENARRDFDIAEFVTNRVAVHGKQDAAMSEAATKFFGNVSRVSAARSAYRNGVADLEYYRDMCWILGQEDADDWLASLQ